MKELFSKPILEIYKLSVADVVCTSLKGFDEKENSGETENGEY